MTAHDTLESRLWNKNVDSLRDEYLAFCELSGDTKSSLPFYDYAKGLLKIDGVQINDDLYKVIIEIDKQI